MSICQYCLCGRAGREAALRVAAFALLLVPGALGVLAGAKEEAVEERL